MLDNTRELKLSQLRVVALDAVQSFLAASQVLNVQPRTTCSSAGQAVSDSAPAPWT